MGRSKATIREVRINYDALPSQQDFHACGARFKGFSGPVGSGKSMALCQEALRLCYLNPGRTGLLGAPTYPMLREATMATLFGILDGNRIRYEHNKSENILVLTDTGSRIVFRPVDDYERLRGTNLAWFGLDELTYCCEEAWLRLEARLRDPLANYLCGFAVWTPKGYDWVYRKFILHPAPGHTAVLAKPQENRFVLDKNPEYYEHLKNTYDEKFYAQEVLGEYLSLAGGRVYWAFDQKVHVEPLKPDLSREILWALDFNVEPMSSLVAQVGRDGKVRVLDEIVLHNSTTKEACEKFYERFPRHPGGLKLYGDASGFQRQTTGFSDYEMIHEWFSANTMLEVANRVPNSNPRVKDRVNLTNRMLRSAAGDVDLLIDPKCKELIADFEEVCFKEQTTDIDKDKDRKRTHTSDALGYLLWQVCQSGRTNGPKSNRLPL